MSLGTIETVYDLSAATNQAGTTGIRPVGVATDGTDLFLGTPASADGSVYRIQSLATPASHSIFSDFDPNRNAQFVAYEDGWLYAINRSQGARGVYRIDPSDGSKSVWADDTTTLLYKPTFRPSNGNLYAISLGNVIKEFDDTGTTVGTHTFSGRSFTGGDWHGDKLYLPDQGGNGSIVVWDPGTGISTLIDDVYDETDHGVPMDLVVASDGRMYMADSDFGQIWSCAPDGSGLLIDVPAASGDVVGPLSVVEIDGWLYSGDWGDRAIYRWPISAAGGLTVGFLQMGGA